MATIFKINGKKFNNPVEWGEISIDAAFNVDATLDAIQPSINISDITIVNEARDYLESVLESEGYFYKVPFSFHIEEDGQTTEAFDGYLENFRHLEESREIVCTPKKDKDMNTLNENLSHLTCALLRDLYELKSMRFVVEEVDNAEKLAILAVTILTYSYILYSQIKDAIAFIGKINGASADAIRLVFGSTIAAIAEGIAIIAFLAATSVQLVKSFIELKELLIPKVRDTKVVSLKSLLEAPLKYLNYTLNTNLDILNDTCIWAKGNNNKKDYYLPNANSELYSPIEVFKLVQSKFEVRYSVIGNVVNCFHVDDPFWTDTADYILPDNVESRTYERNLLDNKSTLTIAHRIDDNDLWTSEEFEGNEYNIFRNIDEIDKSNVKGFNKLIYPVALTSRKNDLSVLEKAWESAVKFINKVMFVFGKSNQNGIINSRIGLPRVTSLAFAEDHLVYLSGSKIPSNHKSIIGAKSDYDNYQYASSFVLNPERTKKKIIKSITIEYSLESFNKNIKNGFFKTKQGILGKFTRISYNSDQKCAVVDYWVNENYKTNLKETYYEPSK